MDDGATYIGKASHNHNRIHGAFRPGGALHDAGYRPGQVRELDWMEMPDSSTQELLDMEASWIESAGGMENLVNRINSPGRK